MEHEHHHDQNQKSDPQGHSKKDGDHSNHHAHMAQDFLKRFWISTALSLPIIALSPMIQGLLGLRESLSFQGDVYVSALLSSIVFFYGGWPFLKGLVNELRNKKPGMMTLIGIAITTAYVYSMLVIFAVEGKIFFWELVTLVDIMLRHFFQV